MTIGRSFFAAAAALILSASLAPAFADVVPSSTVEVAISHSASHPALRRNSASPRWASALPLAAVILVVAATPFIRRRFLD